MSNKGRELDYDEVLSYIGQFGGFQRRIFLLLSLVSAAGGLAVVVFAFTGTYFMSPLKCPMVSIPMPGYTPKYRCRVPQCESGNITYFHNEVRLLSSKVKLFM